MLSQPHASREFASRLPIASLCALASACAIELVHAPLALRAHFVACVIGLALGLGALLGSALRVAFAAIARLPRPLPYLVWPVTSVSLALGLAFRLGALKQLHGGYTELALLVIAAVTIASAAFSLLLCALQPMAKGREAFLPARGPRLRALASILLALAALALGIADRVLYVDLYAIAHVALRFAAVVVGTFAFALSHDRLRLPSWSRSQTLIVALAIGFVIATLNERTPETVQALLSRGWPRALFASAQFLADVDGDGYASILAGGDCRPFDPRVHPGAREIPANGIDDNCALGDAHAQPEPNGQLSPDAGPVPLDVVLITVDSLRRDRVGVYAPADARPSATRVLTPALDAFAQRALVFDHAYTPGGWTSLAIPALMRGVYPRRLRWTRFYETSTHRLLRGPVAGKLAANEDTRWLFSFPIDDHRPALAQRLAARGMRTLAVVDDGRSEILRPGTGFELGFDRYLEVNPGAQAQHDDMSTAMLAISTLAQERGRGRVFLWVHFFGVHSPSERHPSVPYYGSSVADRYDHEVRYFDRALERLLAALELRSRPTAIFISADHGEELDRRVRYHGYSVDEAIISVPLIARVPGWPSGRSQALVSLVDLVPTILALTRSAVPVGLDGVDLAPLLGQTSASSRMLLSDTWRFDINQSLVADFAAAYDVREKLVVDELGYGALRYDKLRPGAEPALQFDPARDRLSRLVYGYLETTGGVPVPSD